MFFQHSGRSLFHSLDCWMCSGMREFGTLFSLKTFFILAQYHQNSWEQTAQIQKFWFPEVKSLQNLHAWKEGVVSKLMFFKLKQFHLWSLQQLWVKIYITWYFFCIFPALQTQSAIKLFIFMDSFLLIILVLISWYISLSLRLGCGVSTNLSLKQIIG